MSVINHLSNSQLVRLIDTKKQWLKYNKTTTIQIEERTYKRLSSEAMTRLMVLGGQGLLLDQFIAKCFREWGQDKTPLIELKEFKNK